MKKIFVFLFIFLALAGCSQKNKDSMEYEKGTINNPYSIGEAVDIIGSFKSNSHKTLYVEGIIIDEPIYDEKNKSYTFSLKDVLSSETIQMNSATLDSSLANSKITSGDKIVAAGYYSYLSTDYQPKATYKINITYAVIRKIIESNTSIDNK